MAPRRPRPWSLQRVSSRLSRHSGCPHPDDSLHLSLETLGAPFTHVPVRPPTASCRVSLLTGPPAIPVASLSSQHAPPASPLVEPADFEVLFRMSPRAFPFNSLYLIRPRCLPRLPDFRRRVSFCFPLNLEVTILPWSLFSPV